ncbi:hypothetical protein TSUD_174720 [Trifolium subterraneum]|uniref:Reverse transcriptase zinc-binding domain-containing protein n=1 Tax=Trifolium subterraneum TaxID=3900 RepID=A0A2Z6NPA0_TRISU|nr:hypothetical protein TSUD_174720 [Trifolium subterraneum]
MSSTKVMSFELNGKKIKTTVTNEVIVINERILSFLQPTNNHGTKVIGFDFEWHPITHFESARINPQTDHFGSDKNSPPPSPATPATFQLFRRKKNCSSLWWRDLNAIRRIQGRGGTGWFEDHLRREVGDGKDSYFWNDPWVDGDTLNILFRRLYDLSLDRESRVAEMIVEEEGDKKINWRWRRRLFQWEKEMVEVCSGLVLEVKRTESDCWKWMDDIYSVKEAYHLLI